MLSGMQPPLGAAGNFPPSQVPGPGTESSSLGHLPSVDQLQKDPQGFSERLKEFKQLREQIDSGEAGAFRAEASTGSLNTLHSSQQTIAAEIMDEVALERQRLGGSKHAPGLDDLSTPMDSLSLTQQVQKTQAAAAKRRGAAQTEETSDEALPDLPMPFPPPQAGLSGTPLAAPTAQRTRSTLPDQYATSQSRSETPEGGVTGAVQPPALAPWAREPGSESHRGPSLKEIQAAEAKKAAKAEEAAAAARKIAVEQEASLLREREKAAATVAPGLPTSSTWANGTPVASTAAPVSPWVKATSVKPSVGGQAAATSAHGTSDRKKTLAEIQREEEARKQKTRDLSSQSPSNSPHGVGKRYAELASRGQSSSAASPVASSSSPVAVASGWATVGAGGKVKTPTAASSSRAVSTAGAVGKPVAAAAASTRSTSRQLSGVAGKADGGVAMDEFKKWLHREVSRGIADGIDGEFWSLFSCFARVYSSQLMLLL